MPLTFFAHQVPVVPLKLWRPRWFDGVALCIGSMAPDFAYPMGDWLGDRSHRFVGIVVWAVPLTLLGSALVRARLASSVFAQVPDCGPLRLHSLRVLQARRPPGWQTLTSALVGASSHVLVDAFTHANRFGSELLGLDAHLFTLADRDFTIARTVQYVGHTFGSLVGLLLVVHIGRTRKPEAWYGAAAVERARAVDVTSRQRVAFWMLVAVGPPAGLLWASTTTESVIFTVIVATAAAIAIAGWTVQPGSARRRELDHAGVDQRRHAAAEPEAGRGQRGA